MKRSVLISAMSSPMGFSFTYQEAYPPGETPTWWDDRSDPEALKYYWDACKDHLQSKRCKLFLKYEEEMHEVGKVVHAGFDYDSEAGLNLHEWEVLLNTSDITNSLRDHIMSQAQEEDPDLRFLPLFSKACAGTSGEIMGAEVRVSEAFVHEEPVEEEVPPPVEEKPAELDVLTLVASPPAKAAAPTSRYQVLMMLESMGIRCGTDMEGTLQIHKDDVLKLGEKLRI